MRLNPCSLPAVEADDDFVGHQSSIALVLYFLYNVYVSEVLLQTKLYVPVTRSSLVPRHKLVERLNAGVQGRLTLVSAPAGFGKSTLVASWGRQMAEAGARRFGWVSLDENDDDVVRFFSYFVAALQKFDGRLGQSTLELLQSAQASNIRWS